MSYTVATAHRLLVEATDALTAAPESGGDAELLSVLTVCEGASRRLDRLTLATVCRCCSGAGRSMNAGTGPPRAR